MSGKPLRVLGIEIDLSGRKAKDDLADWNREVREALGLADEYVDGVDDMAREMRDYAKRIGLTKEQMRELQETSKKNREIGDFAKKYGLEASEIKRIGVEAEEAQKRVSSFNQVMGGLAAIGIGAAAKSIGGEMVDLAKKAERTGITFEVMLKSKDKAKEVLTMLKEFSDVTPFTADDAIKAGKQLINAKVPLDQLKQTLTDIGNVAAGSEVPFNELAEIYAKNKLSGVIQMEDINQLAGRGLPIMDAIGKAMGVQSEQVRALVSSGAVNFDKLRQAFQIMSRDDYPGLMDKLSSSAGGLASTFDSKFSGLKKVLGAALLEGLKPLYSAGIQFFDWLQKSPAAMAAVKLSLLVIIPLIGTLLVAALWSAAAAAWALMVPFLPIIAIVVAVGAAILALTLIIEDLWVWMDGGESLIGSWIDKGGVLGGVIKWLTAPLRLLIWIVRDIWNAFNGGPSVIMDVYGKIKSIFTSIIDFFKSMPDKIVDFFKSIPDRIMSILSGIKDYLKNLLPPAVMNLLVKTGFMDDTKQVKARAGGGDINAGDEYMVGEEGPELFRSDRAGSIIPNHALGGKGKSVAITLAPVFNIRGVSDPETVAALAMKKIEGMLPLLAAELGFGLG